ncbi:hypothetical protein E2562_025900 [Oryza meyeriana var. granulata]|uniref:Uncharacterized protein n=1 Tax=Oryza meyeriana var. granulata TaxID=110450 RepID=A0A6G1CIH9_9ORYZ|nr:hypothetical protein E2562_025900 [Oryza meyeriana var. granulata]
MLLGILLVARKLCGYAVTGSAGGGGFSVAYLSIGIILLSQFHDPTLTAYGCVLTTAWRSMAHAIAPICPYFRVSPVLSPAPQWQHRRRQPEANGGSQIEQGRRRHGHCHRQHAYRPLSRHCIGIARVQAAYSCSAADACPTFVISRCRRCEREHGHHPSGTYDPPSPSSTASTSGGGAEGSGGAVPDSVLL